jgi:hypothetical protein
MPYRNKQRKGFGAAAFLLILLACTSSCSNKAGNEAQNEMPVYESEEFTTFYDRFGKDSLFQLEHTVFPLEGMKRPLDSLDVPDPSFRWEKEEWIMHKTYDDMEGTFSREFMDLGGLVIERISDESGKYTMERRFGKLSDGWNLIYYRELGIY